VQHANDLSYLIDHAQDVENSKISIVAWFARAYRAIGLTGWPPSDPRPAVGHRVGFTPEPSNAAGRAPARPCLLDHLGGAQHDRWGYRKTERFDGLAVHDHLEFGRKLHREIARLRAA